MVSCCANLYELPITHLLFGEFFHPGGAQLTRQVARAALLGPGDRVLDVASGRGASAQYFAEHNGCQLTTLDLSRPNLATNRHHRMQAVQGDACTLPFATRAFDAVICECSLCLCRHPAAALTQMAQVVKPGGHIVLTDLYINGAVPDAFDSPLGEALCIRKALSQTQYSQLLHNAIPNTWRYRDVSWALTELLERVRTRLRRLRENGRWVFDLPTGVEHAAAVISAAESLLATGGAGYGMWMMRQEQALGPAG